MLTPEKIIPFLTHNDPHVRRLAIAYLSKAHDPSPATAEDIWKSIDAFGGGEHNDAYVALASMPQTDGSLQRTLDGLKREPNLRVRSHLDKVIRNLKSGLLMRYSDLIEQAPNLSAETRKHLKQRMELASVPAMELWERLMAFGERADGSGDHELAERLVDALSHSPEAAGWAISTLNEKGLKDWRPIFAVDVLGALRFRRAGEIIMEKFGSVPNADALDDACIGALARIASPPLVEAFQKKFPSWNHILRFGAIEFFRRAKLPQSEMALFGLIQGESDREVRTPLAWALCDLATTHPPAIELLVKMVSTGDFDEGVVELDEEVSALCTMLGKPKPSAKKKSTPPAQAFLGGRPATPAFGDDEEIAPPPQMSVNFEQSSPAAAIKPIKRKGIKVGRNDPCPCGSGKKYKKCCGK